MFKKIGSILQDILDSLNTSDKGFSLRKVLAVVGICFAGHATFKYCNAAVLNAVLSTWLLFIATLLGLVTVQQIMNRNKPKEEDAGSQQDNGPK